jgi:hypothetical protein
MMVSAGQQERTCRASHRNGAPACCAIIEDGPGRSCWANSNCSRSSCANRVVSMTPRRYEPPDVTTGGAREGCGRPPSCDPRTRDRADVRTTCSEGLPQARQHRAPIYARSERPFLLETQFSRCRLPSRKCGQRLEDLGPSTCPKQAPSELVRHAASGRVDLHW